MAVRAPSLLAALALASSCAAPAPSASEGQPADAPASASGPSASAPLPSAPAPASSSAAPAPASSSAAPGSPAAPDATAPAAAKPASAEPPPPRVYAKTRFVWVNYQPSHSSGWLGFLWLGGHADLKSTTPVAGGSGCDAWYEVKPQGYVCVDKNSDRVTLDPDDPTLKALLPYAPNKESPWPHKYGESTGVERYFNLPSVSDQRGREYLYDEHMKHVAEARQGGEPHKSIKGVDLTPGSPEPLALPALPRTLREQRRQLLPLSTVAWSRDFVDAEGRSWLLSADFAYTPKDRVVPYPVSRFHGLHLGPGKDAHLPLAFFREKPRPQYVLDEASQSLRPSGQTWPRLAWVQLTGKRIEQGKEVFQEVEGGLYVNEADAVIPQPQAKTPWGAPVNGDDNNLSPRGRKTWLEISILGGWLIAYEGTTPVYATMISPGRGGIPTRGLDPIETAATPVGSWAITGKFVTATMVAPHEFIHSDVPWTQNFHGPHALHVAYWHDGWGEKKSAGCVNVSPIDGKFLFEWTEPALPEGWHGIRWDKDLSPATQTVLHPLPNGHRAPLPRDG